MFKNIYIYSHEESQLNPHHLAVIDTLLDLNPLIFYSKITFLISIIESDILMDVLCIKIVQ